VKKQKTELQKNHKYPEHGKEPQVGESEIRSIRTRKKGREW